MRDVFRGPCERCGAPTRLMPACCTQAEQYIVGFARGVTIHEVNWYLVRGPSNLDGQNLVCRINRCPWCGQTLKPRRLEDEPEANL